MGNMITLRQAITEMLQTTQALPAGAAQPFAFLAGAGVTSPAIPLAAQLIRDFQALAGGSTDGGPVLPPPETGLARARLPSEYSRDEPKPTPRGPYEIDNARMSDQVAAKTGAAFRFWIDKALPQPTARWQYLAGLEKEKMPPPASNALAQILDSGNIARVVVTPNFDGIISRSLKYIGTTHHVCRNPAAASVAEIYRYDIPAIVHVHGDAHFYAPAIPADAVHGKPVDPPPAMATLLDSIFGKYTPLVVGYSGHELDVIMAALYRRLYDGNRTRSLPNFVYWFCHRPGDAGALPHWLTEHAQVKLVVPGPDNWSSGEGEILCAEDVFAELVDAFKLPEPRVMTALRKYFTQREAAGISRADDQGPSSEGSTAPPGSEGEAYQRAPLLGKVSAAEKRGDFWLVLELITHARFTPLSDQMRFDLYIAETNATHELIMDAVRLSDMLESDPTVRHERVRNVSEIMGAQVIAEMGSKGFFLLGKYEQAILAAGRPIHGGNATGEVALQQQRIASDLLYKGLALDALGQHEQAVATFDLLLRQFPPPGEGAIRLYLAEALLSRAAAYIQLEKVSQAAQSAALVVEHFGGTADRGLRIWVARAMRHQSESLDRMGNRFGTIELCQRMVRDFADFRDPELRELVAEAMLNMAIAYWDISRPYEQLCTLNELLARFENAPEPWLQKKVSRAFLYKAELLDDVNQPAKAILCYGQLLRGFMGSADADITETCARAYLRKARACECLGDLEAAAEACAQLITNFGDSLSPAVKDLVDEARSARRERDQR